MRAVDTNVLVRLVARDEAAQLQIAEDFVAKGAWVSHLVLAETLWIRHRATPARVNPLPFPIR
jgi:predicted nucleic-acid-binding protein